MKVERPVSTQPMKSLSLLAVISIFLLTLPDLRSQAPTPASLVSNGDFQQDNSGDGWPDDWNRADEGVRWETAEGKPFLRFTSPAPGKMVSLFREVPVPVGVKGVEVVFRYRTKGIQPGPKPWFDARAILHFLDADRKELAPDPAPIVFSSEAREWKETRREVLVPKDVATLQIMPCLFQVQAGTLDLAEVRVTAMEDAVVEAIIARKAAEKARNIERAAILEKDLALPAITPELKVEGNQVRTADGRPVWLQGLSVDSMQWSQGENVLWTIRVAIDDWKSNVIRLPVHDTFWYGKGKGQPQGGEVAYRDTVDKAIKLASTRGAWVVLDLHRFGAPTEENIVFWKEVAERYKNNPAVLFELFNEAHGITWEIWRNGGSLKDVKHKDVNPTENTLKMEVDWTPGMQALVKAVRDTGAKNIIVAGGLDWAYDLSGVANGYALDDLGGNGIIYVSHIYPWKRDWQDKVLVAADKYPIIITEVGCPRKWEDFSFIPSNQRYPLEGWSEDMIGLIQKYKLHWTGFSFHPHCGPQVILDWEYTPTPYWGVFVKEALQGRQFELKAMR
jgi:endoglucanase